MKLLKQAMLFLWAVEEKSKEEQALEYYKLIGAHLAGEDDALNQLLGGGYYEHLDPALQKTLLRQVETRLERKDPWSDPEIWWHLISTHQNSQLVKDLVLHMKHSMSMDIDAVVDRMKDINAPTHTPDWVVKKIKMIQDMGEKQWGRHQFSRLIEAAMEMPQDLPEDNEQEKYNKAQTRQLRMDALFNLMAVGKQHLDIDARPVIEWIGSRDNTQARQTAYELKRKFWGPPIIERNKPLNKYDMEYLLEILRRKEAPLTNIELQALINQATTAARDLMRRVIWRDQKNYFILDSEMHPMRLDYTSVPISSLQGKINMAQQGELNEQQILGEFNVVPLF